jgi:hypothetical protein
MAGMKNRSVFRSLHFWVGIVMVVLAACGMLLSWIGLVSLPLTTQAFPVRMRQAFVPSLREAGVPEKRIQTFIMGQVLSSNEVAVLPTEQAQALDGAQQASGSMAATARTGIELARQRCLIGLSICAGLALLGLGVSAWGIKKVRAALRVPPLLEQQKRALT